ncbi:MAG: cache domain-containing protein, partial [Clostridia bacterium]|nr:cache domain-containing protein [Clostridia bacterium]
MKKISRNLMVIGLLFFLLAGLALSVWIAVERFEDIAMTRAEEVMIDSADEQAATLKAILAGQIDALGVAASAVVNSDMTLDAVSERLEIISGPFYCESLAFATTDANIYATAGSSYPDIGKYVIETALTGKNAIQKVRGYLNEDPILFIAVPCYRDGNVIGALRAAYRENIIREMLDSRAYGGDGYSFIIDSGGNIVINSEISSRLSNYSNIMNYLARAAFESGYSRQSMLNDLAAGRQGTVRFSHSGENYIAAYVPMRDEGISGMDWFVVNVIDGVRTKSHVDSYKA